MQTQMESAILAKKLRYEEFTRRMVKSEFIQELVENNKWYRHVLRFLGNGLMFAAFMGAMILAFQVSILLGLLALPVYFYFQGVLIAGIMIHSHELSHNHIKARWLNDLIGILAGYFSFINFYSFQQAHQHHHKNIGNLDTPEAGAPISRSGQQAINNDDRYLKFTMKVYLRSKPVWLLISWPCWLYYSDYNSWMLPCRHANGKLHTGSVVVFALMMAIHLVLLVAFPAEYLGLFVVPMLIGGNRILAISHMHHAHEDSVFFGHEHHNFYSVIMHTTDKDYGIIDNFFMLNNGYHVPHHINTKISYYDLPRASKFLRESLPGDLHYNFYEGCSFYGDVAKSFYDARLERDYSIYQLRFFRPEEVMGELKQKFG